MSAASINIRHFRDEDVTDILSIYRQYILHGPFTFETSVPEYSIFEQRLKAIAAQFPFMVLEENDKILGYTYACSHRERAAYRWAVETSIYISSNYLGRGYGKKLYGNLLETLKKRNFTHAFALIGLPNDNSIKLHKACGFEEQTIHRKAGWKNGQWIDVCWMRCELAAPLDNPAEPIFKTAE
jgi:phosphinothricin acetyltransferase